jgi:hypothetical protein
VRPNALEVFRLTTSSVFAACSTIWSPCLIPVVPRAKGQAKRVPSRRSTVSSSCPRRLRSRAPMATRQQREHERTAKAVPAQGHRHLELLTSQAKRHSATIEREAEKDAWLPNAG